MMGDIVLLLNTFVLSRFYKITMYSFDDQEKKVLRSPIVLRCNDCPLRRNLYY